jgi:class 3 adenylate cyclase/tetratricopeptide (TPR) repeat protein
MTEREKLEQAIAALEAQRAVLGDAVVDMALAPLRDKLAALTAAMTPPPASADEQRKIVTVLFADVSGFTAMSETLDAEEVRDTLNALWQRLDHTITAHGGLIDKHIGDAVMALWGAERAHESDPEQAIRAALAMQAELRAFAETQAHPLQMRIGLNTGPVLLGTIGTTQEFTAMGDTVNLASRMEHAAPIGGILITHDTYRHVRGLFDVQPQAPIQVKGKAEPVQTYIVLRAKPRAFRVPTRGVEGVETRTIGREAELRQLQEVWQTVCRECAPRLVAVVGEAGMGKSRLLYDFQNWLALSPEPMRVFKGRASEEMLRRPYALIRDVFAFLCGMLESDRVAVARQKLEQGIVELLGAHPDANKQAHTIGQWLGLDFSDSPYLRGVSNEAQHIRERALHYLTQCFETATREQAGVLMLEDLHWADDGSLDVISHLAQTCRAPLLIVCMTRPSLFERHAHWGADLNHLTRIELQPLSAQNVERLVDEILRQLPEIPPTLRAAITNNAEGNPFYIEELVKMLIDEKVIVTHAEIWSVALERLKEVHVPQTLTGVLQARLEALSAAERMELQQAAVLGRVFWDSAVEHLNNKTGERPMGTGMFRLSPDDIQQGLRNLRQKELVFLRQSSSFAGALEYIFKHALMRDVIYESILRRERRRYHAQAAEWLIAQSGERAKEYAGLIAEHYVRAEQAAPALRWCVIAAEQALAAWDLADARRWCEQALEVETKIAADALSARVRAERRVSALYLKARLADYVGQQVEALQLIQEAWALAEQHQLDKRAEISLLGGLLYRAANQSDEALQWCERGLALAQTPAQLAQGHNLRAILYRRSGNLIEAEQHIAESIRHAQSIPDYALLDKARSTAALIYNDLGFAREALQQFDFILAQEAGWPLPLNRKASLQINRGEAFRRLGRLSEAERCNREVLKLLETSNIPVLRLLALMNLGAIYAKDYRLDSAFESLEKAQTVREQTGIRQSDAELYHYLSLTHLARGHTSLASDYIQKAITHAQQARSLADHGAVLRTQGLVQGMLEHWAAAEGSLQQSYVLLGQANNRHQQALTAGALRYFYRTRLAHEPANQEWQALAEQYHAEALRVFAELGAQLDLEREQREETNVLNWV